MAEKADKKADAAAAAAAAPAKDAAGEKKDAKAGGLMTKTPVMLGMVMLLEAAVLFAGFKFLGGGPKPVSAIDLKEDGHGGKPAQAGDGHGKPVDRSGVVEVPVVEIKALNAQNGRKFIYDTSVVITIKTDAEPKVKDKIKACDGLIKDRMRTIIAQMDPDKLGGGSEPGLETLRRQIKTQLEIIIGDGMIDEVLVPRCTPFRADF